MCKKGIVIEIFLKGGYWKKKLTKNQQLLNPTHAHVGFS